MDFIQSLKPHQQEMKIVFATNNAHKLDEIRAILGTSIEVLSLNDIGCHDDIPETGTTLEQNAVQKAQYIWDHYRLDVFADDTGLEVEALGGRPGVYTARFATLPLPDGTMPPLPSAESHDSDANVTRLLWELEKNNNRKAQFRTAIALIQKDGGQPACHLFEGIVRGEIASCRRGTDGFGYDPVFIPEGYDLTFAEMGADIKNQISHRARATKQLADFLAAQNRQ